jgi:RNA 2',3'-cyclic 3'-phosphodiesterase
MFVALPLPEPVKDDMAGFLEPRQAAGGGELGLRWTLPGQWHVTLAFLADVADRNSDELLERLERAATRRKPFVLRMAGAGAYPHAGSAKVLWTGVEHEGEELMRLAGGARAAAAKSGIAVGGGRFHPHLTLARVRPPSDVTRLLRVLEGYSGPSWQVGEVALIASYLGQGPDGRPRHVVQQTFELGRPSMG